MVSPGGGGFAYDRRVRLQRRVEPAAVQPARDDAGAARHCTCAPRTLPTGGGTPGRVADDRVAADQPEHARSSSTRSGSADTYGATAETNVVAALTRLAGDALARRQRRRHPGRGARPDAVRRLGREPVQRQRGERRREHDRRRDRCSEGRAPEPQVRRLRRRRRPDPVLPGPRSLADRERERASPRSSGRTSTTARSRAATCSPTTRTSTRGPIPASGRQLFIPDLVGGRLVETPAQIVSARSRSSRRSSGTLAGSTAFVSGYDFVSDGSQRVAQSAPQFRILGNGPTRHADRQHLVEERPVRPRRSRPAGPAAINDWNGHYDNHAGARGERRPHNLIGPPT